MKNLLIQALALAAFLDLPLLAEEKPAPTVTGADESAFATTVTLHVNRHHAAAAPGNPGTEDKPLPNLGTALQRAQKSLRAGEGVKILVHPGLYREGELYLRTHEWPEIGQNAPLVIEGTDRDRVIFDGTVDVSGSWASASSDHPGLVSMDWPHDWGLGDNIWWDVFDVVIEALGSRRETVWVNGELMQQQLLERWSWHDPDGPAGRDPEAQATSVPGAWKYEGFTEPESLLPGSYGVAEREENGNRIYLRMPADRGLRPKIEVGMRELFLVTREKHNVTLRNLTIQRYNGFIIGRGRTAVMLQGNNQLVENCRVVWNNSRGLGLGKEFRDITVRKSHFDHNGWSGLQGSLLRNALVEDCTTNHNNWRGYWGNQTGCDAAGAKFMGPDNDVGMVVRRHVSTGNLTHGFWFDHCDTGPSPVRIEDSIFAGNLHGHQLYLEKQTGPIQLERCVLWSTQGGYSALYAIIHHLHARGNLFYSASNGWGPISLGSRSNSAVYWSENWDFRNNLVVTDRPGVKMFARYGPTLEKHALWVDSFRGEGNHYFNYGNESGRFDLKGEEPVGFAKWLEHMGEREQKAGWGDPGLADPRRLDWRPGKDSPVSALLEALPAPLETGQ